MQNANKQYIMDFTHIQWFWIHTTALAEMVHFQEQQQITIFFFYNNAIVHLCISTVTAHSRGLVWRKPKNHSCYLTESCNKLLTSRGSEGTIYICYNKTNNKSSLYSFIIIKTLVHM